MNLSNLHNHQTAFVRRTTGSPSLRLRLEELGFVPGQEVTRLFATPMGTPIVFAMLGQRVALRSSEAELIEVSLEQPDIDYASEETLSKRFFSTDTAATYLSQTPSDHPASCDSSSCGGCSACGPSKPLAPKAEGTITVALIGNPNCGKTTVFNALSGGHERTGNYAGVTVSSVVGEITHNCRTLRFVDLPGTYSLRAYSPEEAYVMSELRKGDIDVVLNVLDVNNLERNLLLTLQVRRMGLPMVGALNLYDEFTESGSSLDIDRLSEHIALPLVPCVANKGKGMDELLAQLIEAYDSQETFAQSLAEDPHAQSDPHALVHHYLSDCYDLKEGRAVRLTHRVDRWLVRHGLSYFAFFAVMWLVFWATFTIGQFPMDWMDAGVKWLTEWSATQLPANTWYTDLISSGIIGGVGAVIVFLPQILILYFFISILEDSGYLARAALLFDPILRRVGLHGKSFFPMLTGFGCNVPAVMATRTIENRKSRLLTMITLPFMSCSARLTVYTVFTLAFFPHHATWVMFGLYTFGIFSAFGSAWLMSHFIRRREESHFVMEIPPYRRPVASSVLHHTWEKGRQYLRKMGGLILVASVIIWLLGYFPRGSADLTPSQQQEQSYLGQAAHAIQPAIAPLGFDWRMGVGLITGSAAKELMVSTLGVLYQLDEDTAAAAGTGQDDTADSAISQALQQSSTPAAALSYMVFALLYFPCIATIAAIKGESGQWRYAVISMLYTTGFAYVMAFIAYRIALLW